jgi:hypothetical protein
MIQLPFQGPLPPGFVTQPLDWFQFAMLYLAFVELVLLALSGKWRDRVIAIAFHLPRKQCAGASKD